MQQLFDKKVMPQKQTEDATQVLSKMISAIKLFQELYGEWKAIRKFTLRQVALVDLDKLHKHQKKVDVTKIASGTAGIASVAGVALAPFTFGTSLMLTVGGVGIAAVSAGVSLRATRNIRKHEKASIEEFMALCQDDIAKTQELQECLREIHALDDLIQALVLSWKYSLERLRAKLKDELTFDDLHEFKHLDFVLLDAVIDGVQLIHERDMVVNLTSVTT